ncbi:rta1 domain-containing protein [Botrytis cinerea]
MPVANVCRLGTCPLEYGMVHYQPTLFGNVFYLSIFAALLIMHIIQLWRWSAWSFSCCMLTGLILEITGYLDRIKMHYDPFCFESILDVRLPVITTCYLICVTIAPVFFTASIHMTYSRIILHYAPHLSSFTPKAISITFMAADWIALILQAAGGAIADTAATEAGMKSGTDILVAGLSFQVLGLIVFMIVVVDYTLKVSGERTRRQAANWATGLTVATVLILIRSIFRVVELAKGFQSKLANEEVPFMILEGAVMILATTIMTIFHPGLIIKGKWKESGWELKGWKNERN